MNKANPHLVTYDFFFFGFLSFPLKGCYFKVENELLCEVTNVLTSLSSLQCKKAMDGWINRLHMVIEMVHMYHNKTLIVHFFIYRRNYFFAHRYQKTYHIYICEELLTNEIYLLPWSFSDETIIALQQFQKKLKFCQTLITMSMRSVNKPILQK